MYSLPSLAPQDSHSLWYTSSHTTPLTPPSHLDPLHNEHLPTSLTPATAGPTGHQVPHRRHHASHHRHPLARLRMDEESMARRRQNVQNYGNSWIRPPGIAKSLYQMREEKREMEEHQEAMRREALAQELAEAEAEGLEDMMRRDGEGEGVGEMDEGRDLDEDVPEGDADVTGLGDEEDDEEEEGDGGDRVNGGEEVPRGVLASRMPEDVYREALVRGEEARGAMFGDEGGSTVDEEDRAQMLQEEDLVHETHEHGDLDMDGDVNLDDDIPEAEEGGYEHTDTEAELTSSEEESVDEGLFNRHQPASSMVRSDGTQNSMDIGSLRSQGSSQMGSSPAPRAGFRSRRGGS